MDELNYTEVGAADVTEAETAEDFAPTDEAVYESADAPDYDGEGAKTDGDNEDGGEGEKTDCDNGNGGEDADRTPGEVDYRDVAARDL